MLVAVLFFMSVALIITLGMATPAVREHVIARDLIDSKKSYFLAESGVEDVFYKIKNNKQTSASEVLTLDGSSTTTTVTDSGYNEKTITSLGIVGTANRKLQSILSPGVGVAFNYGIQVGNGGIVMGNSTITGNVYSNGPIMSNNTKAKITGSAVAAGQSAISTVKVGTTATDLAWAHWVHNSTMTGPLYCTNGTSNNKPCDTSRGSAPSQNFPISDDQIQEWKDEALTGGTNIGNMVINDDTSIGPKKIVGNVSFGSNNKILTLNGTVWITGNLTMSNGSTIKLAPSYGGSSGLIIVDGTINISNNGNFTGSGTAGSYVMVVTPSMTSPAISVSNNAGAVVLVALNSKVYFAQNGAAKAVVANQVELENNATVSYETGLVDANFTNGPGGAWELQTWKEVQ